MSVSKADLDQIIEDMARAGFNREVEGNDWRELGERSIVRAHWKEIAKEMLRAVKQPSQLYLACQMLHLGDGESKNNKQQEVD